MAARRREVAGVRIDGANREVLRDKRVEDCGESSRLEIGADNEGWQIGKPEPV